MTDARPHTSSQPYTPPPARVPTGQKSWALGFIAWAPLPVLPLIGAAIVMMAVRPSAERSGHAVAAENARHAANWALTVVTVLVVLALYVAVLAVAVPDARQGFFPIGLAVIGYLALAIAHGILTIAGTVVAGNGRVLNPRIAVPFIRAR